MTKMPADLYQRIVYSCENASKVADLITICPNYIMNKPSIMFPVISFVEAYYMSSIQRGM